MENERLRDAVVIGVVVENGLQEGSWDYSPCFVHHLTGRTPGACSNELSENPLMPTCSIVKPR